jgi:glycosyltransferase involved in cell wall biosynthesis
MASPLVSVVIPTFHRERDVVRAARSALDQTGVNVEVLVLDDSAENSAELHLTAIADPRLRYERCTTPSGGVPARVRNRGLALVRGEFVHLLDDDDTLLPGALEALSSALVASPESGVAVGVVQPVGQDAGVLAKEEQYFAKAAARLRHVRSRRDLCAALLFTTTPLVNSACMIRREVARAIGGYAEDIARCEDAEFYLRAIRASGCRFVDRTVVRYQTGLPSLMHSLTDDALVEVSYDLMHERYRRAHGALEYLWLRALVSTWPAQRRGR